MNDKIIRPGFVDDEHLEYLDELRASGETNMYGAGAYLREDFFFTRNEARDVLGYWMKTFSNRHPQEPPK